jgi:DNA-binding response OmpR family regulator
LLVYLIRKKLVIMSTNDSNIGRIHHVLVVEDNLHVRNVTCEFLTMMGFSVRDAEDGREALEMVRRENFDLIITDFMMPVMNGKELIREVRQVKGERLPIILVSGLDLENKDMLQNAYTRTLRKPYAFQTLINNIGALESLHQN